MNRKKDLPPFDDFLGLKETSFANTKLLVFNGISGSGKSSYLNFLAKAHPDFKNLSQEWIWTMHQSFQVKPNQKKCLFLIDEIASPLQLPSLIRIKKSTAQWVVASHIHRLWFRLLLPQEKIKFYHTDHSTKKLETWMHRWGISFSKESLLAFQKKYGSSYVDLKCILERSPKKDLDYALNKHFRMDSIKIEKCSQWTPSMPKFNFSDKNS